MRNRKTVYASWIDDLCTDLEAIQDAIKQAINCIEDTEEGEESRAEVRRHINDLRAEWMDHSESINGTLKR